MFLIADVSNDMTKRIFPVEMGNIRRCTIRVRELVKDYCKKNCFSPVIKLNEIHASGGSAMKI
jgi:hypothetical protein